MGDYPPLARVIPTIAHRNDIPGGDAIISGTAKIQLPIAHFLWIREGPHTAMDKQTVKREKFSHQQSSHSVFLRRISPFEID